MICRASEPRLGADGIHPKELNLDDVSSRISDGTAKSDAATEATLDCKRWRCREETDLAFLDVDTTCTCSSRSLCIGRSDAADKSKIMVSLDDCCKGEATACGTDEGRLSVLERSVAVELLVDAMILSLVGSMEFCKRVS